MEFCNLKAQYQAYAKEIDLAMANVLESCAFINGPQVEALEQELSEFTGSYAVTCASGTDALQLALYAAGVGPGDEVITTPFTFVATAEMIALIGAIPVFVDISPLDFNIDANKIREKITSKTKAIIPVSLYGQIADMLVINKIAQEHNLVVIEDGAQSFGATYYGKKSGNLSPLATTSFFPAKPLGCYGDGGAVFTQSEQMVGLLKTLRNHGQSQRYHHSHVGVNSRLDTLQAAVLQVKLKHFPQEVERREQLAQRYTQGLKVKYTTPFIVPRRTSVWAQYTLLCPTDVKGHSRDDLQKYLAECGIPTAVHYPMPLHLQQAYAYLNTPKGSCPVAEDLAQRVISLPMSAFLTDEEQDEVIRACDRF
jgi:UDP-2-acetamido-2-deoxy-ribo-hexuluronate aminotransferase